MIAVLKILADIGLSSFDLGHHWDDLACKCSQSGRGGCVTTNNGDNRDATSIDDGAVAAPVLPFTTNIRVEVTAWRRERLAAALTIWRWRRVASDIEVGAPPRTRS
jgi:hypothetical protein